MSRFLNNALAMGLAATVLLQGCAGAPSREAPPAAAESSKADLPQVYQQALTLMGGGEYRAAIPVLRRFSATQPRLAGPFINLGIAYARTGEPQAALAALDKALELNAASAAAQLQRGILYRQLGDFQTSLAAYEQALSLNPDYALAHRNIGILYDLYLQQPALALTHYKRYLSLSGGADKTVNGWVIDLERRVAPATASIDR